MNISKAMSICHKNNIKVYPVVNGFKFKIQVNISGVKKTYPPLLTTSTVNEALTKTYIYYAEKC